MWDWYEKGGFVIYLVGYMLREERGLLEVTDVYAIHRGSCDEDAKKWGIMECMLVWKYFLDAERSVQSDRVTEQAPLTLEEEKNPEPKCSQFPSYLPTKRCPSAVIASVLRVCNTLVLRALWTKVKTNSHCKSIRRNRWVMLRFGHGFVGSWHCIVNGHNVVAEELMHLANVSAWNGYLD